MIIPAAPHGPPLNFSDSTHDLRSISEPKKSCAPNPMAADVSEDVVESRPKKVRADVLKKLSLNEGSKMRTGRGMDSSARRWTEIPLRSLACGGIVNGVGVAAGDDEAAGGGGGKKDPWSCCSGLSVDGPGDVGREADDLVAEDRAAMRSGGTRSGSWRCLRQKKAE